MDGGHTNYAVLLPSQLILGNVKGARDASLLDALHVGAVVNLILYEEGHVPASDKPSHIEQWLHCPVEDRPRTDLASWAPRVGQWIHERVAEGCVVYVHCSQGVSRAPSACIYYVSVLSLALSIFCSWNLLLKVDALS